MILFELLSGRHKKFGCKPDVLEDNKVVY